MVVYYGSPHGLPIGPATFTSGWTHLIPTTLIVTLIVLIPHRIPTFPLFTVCCAVDPHTLYLPPPLFVWTALIPAARLHVTGRCYTGLRSGPDVVRLDYFTTTRWLHSGRSLHCYYRFPAVARLRRAVVGYPIWVARLGYPGVAPTRPRFPKIDRSPFTFWITYTFTVGCLCHLDLPH